MSGHLPDVAFGLLAAAQLGDAVWKGDRKASIESLENAGILAAAALLPLGVETAVKLRGGSEVLARRWGTGVGAVMGGGFTLLSTIGMIQARMAYSQAAQQGDRGGMADSAYAMATTGVDAAATGLATFGSVFSRGYGTRLGQVGTAALAFTIAGSFANHALGWYEGPEGTRAAGEWLLEKAGISSPVGGADSGQSESRQSVSQRTPAEEQLEALYDLGDDLKDPQTRPVTV